MLNGLLAMFPNAEPDRETVAWLDRSCFDELYEVDALNDICHNLFHIEGKYHVPIAASTYRGLFAYSVESMVHPDDRDTFAALMSPDAIMGRLAAGDPRGMASCEYRQRLQNGGWRWVELVVVGGEHLGIPKGVARCYVFDIQNQKDRERGAVNARPFESESFRDEKTSLVWEKEFFDRAHSFAAEVERGEWCLVAIDVDHFRLFNDWYGREAGDLLLARMGEILAAEEAATGGLAGYFGQDDFYIIMPASHGDIASLHDRLSSLFEQFTSAIGFRIAFGVTAIDGKTPFLDLFDQAKVALGVASGDYKKDICFFEPGMLERMQREYELLLDFRRALSNREFVVFVQPQCRISSGKVAGVEALVRWCKPNGEIVLPGDFIPVLEESGFVTDLDMYVWDEVCANLRKWREADRVVVPVSVNVSQIDLFAIDVPEYLGSLLDKYDIPPSLLKVEFTESAFASSAAVVEDVVQRLREKGIVVLMDDFGSGYSSLNMLGSLTVDAIKLDAMFLRMDGEDKRKSVRIVESIINMAKTMALPVVTEGVETYEQVEFLESLGCRYIQGYYYYRPMPLSDFEELIGNGEQVDARGFTAKLNDEMHVRELLDRNVYSDAMLNGVLGPVAFYLQRGDHIDITRFNQRFYEIVGEPQFDKRLKSIEEYMPVEERAKMFDLLGRACADEINGAVGMVGTYRTDGVLVRFLLHCYYLGENAEGKQFYASVRDVTDIVEWQVQVREFAEDLLRGESFARDVAVVDSFGEFTQLAIRAERTSGTDDEPTYALTVRRG